MYENEQVSKILDRNSSMKNFEEKSFSDLKNFPTRVNPFLVESVSLSVVRIFKKISDINNASTRAMQGQNYFLESQFVPKQPVYI